MAHAAATQSQRPGSCLAAGPASGRPCVLGLSSPFSPVHVWWEAGSRAFSASTRAAQETGATLVTSPSAWAPPGAQDRTHSRDGSRPEASSTQLGASPRGRTRASADSPRCLRLTALDSGSNGGAGGLWALVPAPTPEGHTQLMRRGPGQDWPTAAPGAGAAARSPAPPRDRAFPAARPLHSVTGHFLLPAPHQGQGRLHPRPGSPRGKDTLPECRPNQGQRSLCHSKVQDPPPVSRSWKLGSSPRSSILASFSTARCWVWSMNFLRLV